MDLRSPIKAGEITPDLYVAAVLRINIPRTCLILLPHRDSSFKFLSLDRVVERNLLHL